MKFKIVGTIFVIVIVLLLWFFNTGNKTISTPPQETTAPVETSDQFTIHPK